MYWLDVQVAWDQFTRNWITDLDHRKKKGGGVCLCANVQNAPNLLTEFKMGVMAPRDQMSLIYIQCKARRKCGKGLY